MLAKKQVIVTLGNQKTRECKQGKIKRIQRSATSTKTNPKLNKPKNPHSGRTQQSFLTHRSASLTATFVVVREDHSQTHHVKRNLAHELIMSKETYICERKPITFVVVREDHSQLNNKTKTKWGTNIWNQNR